MKKRKLIILAITIIAAALLLEGFILKYVNDRNADRTSKVLLDRVITVLDKNDESEKALIKSLKDDYIVRAKAVSYIIDAKPEVEYDVDELQKIAALISVDEIHLFDTKGYIYSGSVPKYFGYSFDSGEQMAYFKPMLKDKKLTMCQDVTPNTSEAKEMMYAITWNEAGNKMIQVGIEPKRLLNEAKQNEVSNVVANMPVYKGMEILEKVAGMQGPKFEADAAEANRLLTLYTNNRVAELQTANDQDGIIAMADKMLEQNPANALAQKIRLQAYLTKKDYAKVIELGEAAAAAQPDETEKSDVYFILGAAYNAKEMKPQAIEALKKVTAGDNVAAAQKSVAELSK